MSFQVGLQMDDENGADLLGLPLLSTFNGPESFSPFSSIRTDDLEDLTQPSLPNLSGMTLSYGSMKDDKSYGFPTHGEDSSQGQLNVDSNVSTDQTALGDQKEDIGQADGNEDPAKLTADGFKLPENVEYEEDDDDRYDSREDVISPFVLEKLKNKDKTATLKSVASDDLFGSGPPAGNYKEGTSSDRMGPWKGTSGSFSVSVRSEELFGTGCPITKYGMNEDSQVPTTKVNNEKTDSKQEGSVVSKSKTSSFAESVRSYDMFGSGERTSESEAGHTSPINSSTSGVGADEPKDNRKVVATSNIGEDLSIIPSDELYASGGGIKESEALTDKLKKSEGQNMPSKTEVHAAPSTAPQNSVAPPAFHAPPIPMHFPYHPPNMYPAHIYNTENPYIHPVGSAPMVNPMMHPPTNQPIMQWMPMHPYFHPGPFIMPQPMNPDPLDTTNTTYITPSPISKESKPSITKAKTEIKKSPEKKRNSQRNKVSSEEKRGQSLEPDMKKLPGCSVYSRGRKGSMDKFSNEEQG